MSAMSLIRLSSKSLHKIRCDVFQDFLQMFRSDLPKYLPGPDKTETEGTVLSSVVKIRFFTTGKSDGSARSDRNIMPFLRKKNLN